MSEKKHLKTTVAVVLLGVAVAVGSCAAGPEIIKFAGKGTVAGEVAFSHEKHLKEAEEGGYGISCEKCHHSVWQVSGLPSRKCRSCHKREGEKLRMEDAAHELCGNCHYEQSMTKPSSSVPISCDKCHVSIDEEK
jgi:hypothetical protein